MIIFRNSSALLLSFLIHASMAMGAVTLYKVVSESIKDAKQNKPMCLCLSQVKIEPSLPKVQPPPVIPPVIEEKIVQSVPEVLPKPVVKTVKKTVPKKEKIVQKPEPLQEPVEEIIEETPVVVAVAPQAPLKHLPELQPNVKSIKERYLKEHLQVIAQLLRKNLYYPTRARKRHIEGEVVMVFEVLQSGSIGSVTVKQGDKDILNRAAIKTINKLSGKIPKPSQTISIEIPIQFKLTS